MGGGVPSEKQKTEIDPHLTSPFQGEEKKVGGIRGNVNLTGSRALFYPLP
jgi:hypothetical protein